MAGAFANTRILPGTWSHCDAWSNIVIAVTRDNSVIRSASIDLYREVENGERKVWSGTTDNEGLAHPPRLEAGEYRVFVDAGDRSGTIDLAVSGDSQDLTRCNLDFVQEPSHDSAYPLGENFSVIELRELRGTVVDPSAAVIRRARVILQRRDGEQFRDVGSTETDSRGEFDLREQRRGIYRVIVVVPGFCRISTLTSLSNTGSVGMEIRMPIASNVPGDCTKELRIVTRDK
jgi:hypothetical protein